ncbi:MFS transporter [Haloplasma contractile]|uniref:Tetracycline resistance protein n=1 Tax=Haloplasma contractile SSD-17B TaxID=1033810 RepID=F7PVW2_9MOLU|nr:MFS transporter [Haloplasma contractile]ERJ12715.1 Tetracycline resistance protein [Haloplasma contractile SSD-17B]
MFTDKDRNAVINRYLNNPNKLQKLYRKTLTIIVLSQIFGGAGLAAGVTVGALLAKDMLGVDRLAGIPSAVFTLGSAIAAFLIGRLTQKLGRRVGLSFGFFTGSIGAFGVIISAVTDNVYLLIISLFIYGSGSATNLLARYAGTDLASTKQRGSAISVAMVSTTLGAVAGPILVDIMGEVATSMNIPKLGGPFILACVTYMLAGLIFLFFLRPDPLIIAKQLTVLEEQDKEINQIKDNQIIDKHGLFVGSTVMVLSQVIMVAIMTMTPVHMDKHGYELSDVGIIIGIHIGAMYLPSLFTGILVDKLGRSIIIYFSALSLFGAGILAAFAPTNSMFILTIALALLGIGWNFGLISGTAIIVDSTDLKKRAKVQGSLDVFIALGGAFGGAISGIILDYYDFATLSIIGAVVSLSLVPLVIWWRKDKSKGQQIERPASH